MIDGNVIKFGYGTVIVIDGYTLDFSNFNRKSVEVVLDHAYSAYYNYLRLCAC